MMSNGHRIQWIAGFLAAAALLGLVISATLSVAADSNQSADGDNGKQPAKFPELPEGHEIATIAGGCFWCVEEVIRQQEGVLAVLSGYSGGKEETANYRMVSKGLTRHAEALHVYYDPNIIDYDGILEALWDSHDPTQLNRQGNDVGPQYRSAIFYHDESQKQKAEASIRRVNESGKYAKPVVTELVAFEKFYPAENYHQDFFELNPNNPYCNSVLVPKLKKLGLDYPGKPKSEEPAKQ